MKLFRWIMIVIVLLPLVPVQQYTQAAPLTQMNWQQQCQFGQQYYLLDQVLDGKRLLEAGLTAAPDTPTDATTAGFCAFWLGHLHLRTGNLNGALTAFQTAHGFFDQTNDPTMAILMRLAEAAAMLPQGRRDETRDILTTDVLPYIRSSSADDWPSPNFQALVEAAALASLGLAVGLDDEFLAGDTAAAREYFTEALDHINNLPNPDAAEGLSTGGVMGALIGGGELNINLSDAVTCLQAREAVANGEPADTNICTTLLMQMFGQMFGGTPEGGEGFPFFPPPGDSQNEDAPGSWRDEPISPEDALELIEGLSGLIPADDESASAAQGGEVLENLLEEIAEQPIDSPTPLPVDESQDTDSSTAQLDLFLELIQNPDDIDPASIGELFLGGNPLDALGAQIAPMFRPILLNNIAETYRYEGNIDMALDYYEQALAQIEQLRMQATLPGYAVFANIVEGIVLNNEGLLYFDLAEQAQEQGDNVTAWENYSQALPNFDTTFQRMEEFRQRLGVASVLVNRSQVKLRLADLLDRDPGLGAGDPVILREEAFADLDIAVQEVETLRVAGDNRIRDIVTNNGTGIGSAQALSGSLSPLADVFNFAVLLAHQLGEDDQAFAFSERGRARVLLDMLTTGQLELSDSDAQILLNQEREQFIMRQLATDVLEQAKVSDDEQYRTLIPALEEQSTRAEEEYQATRRAIQQQYPQLLSLLEGTGGILSPESVHQELERLDEPTTLVAYYMIDERVDADAPVLAFILNADMPGVTTIELPEATSASLDAPMNDLITWSTAPKSSDVPDTVLRDLHAALIEPLQAEGVLATTQLGIVPHQQLHYVPFAALDDGKDYLIERHALFVLPSASVLKLANDALDNQSPATEPVALIYGNPTNDRPVLSNAGTEARNIATMFGSTAYTRDAATEHRLRAQVEDAHLVHLAAHAQYLGEGELSSAIYLAEDSDKHHDGILNAAEILVELRLPNTELIVLSACESSAGKPSTGDEIVSLTRSLITAGSPSVIATLWQVDDEATGDLMTDFYHSWQEDGMNKAAALRTAQQTLIERDQNPYYWGAFILYGNPDAGKVQFEIEEATPTATSTVTAELTNTATPTATPNATSSDGDEPISPTAEPDRPVNPPSPGCFSFGLIMIGLVVCLRWSRRSLIR